MNSEEFSSRVKQSSIVDHMLIYREPCLTLIPCMQLPSHGNNLARRCKWRKIKGRRYFQVSKNKWLVINITFNLMDI